MCSVIFFLDNHFTFFPFHLSYDKGKECDNIQQLFPTK